MKALFCSFSFCAGLRAAGHTPAAILFYYSVNPAILQGIFQKQRIFVENREFFASFLLYFTKPFYFDSKSRFLQD